MPITPHPLYNNKRAPTLSSFFYTNIFFLSGSRVLPQLPHVVLLSSVEMRNAPWVMWIHDLSTPDPYYILPLVMTLTTVLQTALNPQPPDPLQAKLMWFMPLAFSVMFFFFPAGLVLYWITNNVLSIAQQWMINTRMGVPPQFNLPKFK